MSIGGALVLYAVIWFLCLFIALPRRIRTQQEDGRVLRGTPPSAPSNPLLVAKLKWVTLATTIIWAVIALVVAFELVTIKDIDFFDRWGDGQYG